MPNPNPATKAKAKEAWNSAIVAAVKCVKKLAKDADNRVDRGLSEAVLLHAANKIGELKRGKR